MRRQHVIGRGGIRRSKPRNPPESANDRRHRGTPTSRGIPRRAVAPKLRAPLPRRYEVEDYLAQIRPNIAHRQAGRSIKLPPPPPTQSHHRPFGQETVSVWISCFRIGEVSSYSTRGTAEIRKRARIEANLSEPWCEIEDPPHESPQRGRDRVGIHRSKL